MAEFIVRLRTDDAKDAELYGRPYDAEGLQTGLEAAFAQNGLEVLEIREAVPDEMVPVVL